MTEFIFDQIIKEHPDKNRELDRRMSIIANKIYNSYDANTVFIVDARLGWYVFEGSINIRLTVSPEVAGKRAYIASQNGERGKEENFSSEEEATIVAAKRRQAEIDLYKNLYKNIDGTRN